MRGERGKGKGRSILAATLSLDMHIFTVRMPAEGATKWGIRYSLNRGFANRGFRNRGNVPCAHAKTCVQGSLSQGFRIPVEHSSGHAKAPVSRTPVKGTPGYGTVSFHNFKSRNFKLSVSNPKSKYVAYSSVLSQISNCQGLGRKNKHEILKTDRMASGAWAPPTPAGLPSRD